MGQIQTVKVIVEVTTEMVQTTIEMGGYGIAYWCKSAHHDEEAQTYTIEAYVDPDGGPETASYVLTYLSIAQWIERLYTNDQQEIPNVHWVGKHYRDYLIGMDPGNMDSDLADCVIQLAALGEVRYG